MLDFTCYQGDCLELMPHLVPDKSVDLILCDLPYGTTQNRWDVVIPFEPLWAELRRVAKPGAAMVFTAAQPFSSLLVTSNLKEFKHDWIWEKNKASGHLNANRKPLRAHEDILVFCISAPPYFPQMTDGHAPGNYAKNGVKSDCYGATKGAEYGGSTLRFPRTVQKFAVMNNDDPEKWLPTQKPVPLFEYLINTYSTEGQTVLDVCFGSGTTGVACANTGRNFIGFEKTPETYSRAYERIKRAYGLC